MKEGFPLSGEGWTKDVSETRNPCTGFPQALPVIGTSTGSVVYGEMSTSSNREGD